MSTISEITTTLPFLRRYARAVTGSQASGDTAVREILRTLLEEPPQVDQQKITKILLYRICTQLLIANVNAPSTGNGRSQSIMLSLPLRNRQSLLLVSVEGFSTEDVAQILDISTEQVESDIAQARQAIQNLLIAKVMIIEDEPLIALHLEAIVKEIGHTVCGVARTRAEAVEVAQQTTPDIVLADISLADGSSGIDAVKDILSVIDVPVIFITAFPERLLTGERPEPTYLITKPFESETVTATIGQALLFYNEQQALMREMA